MAGEAEISFEEAMGTPAATSSSGAAQSPALLQEGEISFADVMGPEATQVPFTTRLRENISRTLETRGRAAETMEHVRGQLFDKATGVDLNSPSSGFFEHAGKSVLGGLRALITSPTKAATGGVKATVAGVTGLGESAVAGVRGLGRMAGESIVKETVGRIPHGVGTAPIRQMITSSASKDPLAAAVGEIGESMEQTAQLRDIASQITKVNLAPVNEQDRAMEDLLMLLPEGIAAAGDTVYEKFGSAVAGAGTQALLTLITLNPQLVGKVVTRKSAPKISEKIGELAKEDLPAAEAVVGHIEKSAPAAGKKMRARLNQETGKWEPVVMGEKAVAKQTKGVEITAEEAGVGMSESAAQMPVAPPAKPAAAPKPKQAKIELLVDEQSGQFEVKAWSLRDLVDPVGEALAQESGRYLQVKRTDVKATERRMGHTQEMMTTLLAEADKRGLVLGSDFSVSKDAQRVYEALGKKGFTVKENPNTVNPETGSKVSNDPRVPVYEVSRKAEPAAAATKPAAAAPEKIIDLSGAGKAIGENLRAAMWDSFQKGSSKVAGLEEPVVKAALRRKGQIKTREQFDAFAKKYTEAKAKFDAERAKGKAAAPVPTPELPAATPAEAAKVQQVFVSGPTLDAIPGGQFIRGKLTGWWDELIRAVNPEALGPKAKQAAAVLAEKIAQTMNRDSANIGLSGERLAFWEKIPVAETREFMRRYEQGKPQKTPELQAADKYLRERAKEIYQQDQRNGIKYDPVDNYLYHVFSDGEKLSKHFEAKYGDKWGDPSFTKDRAFDLYEEAINAGYRPKFTNPEDIILARQQASDIAQMRVELLRDLESYGLAQEITKANPGPPPGNYNHRRAPTGKNYWVEATADAVLYNAFDTKSLWSMPGIRGDLFKGFMFLKNHTVPAVLSLSLFHPLHLLLGMDSAAAMTRLTKEMVVSGMNPVKWFGKWLEQMTLGSKGIPLWGIVDNPRVGFRLLQAVEGKLDPAKLTMADLTALQYMTEGGFAPVQPIHMRANSLAHFRQAVRSAAAELNGPGGLRRAAEPAAKATFHAPFAIIDALQYPMFRLWIPALKISSYLKDVQTALKIDPTLAQDKARRILTFRKLSKSVDNRYGEMNYNTLFWNRLIKDTAVANMLSLGWNLGFVREYGGGALDAGRAVRKGKLVEKVKSGDLDRSLFVMFYTTQVMLYSGLITWAMTGELPTELADYLYPKSGDKDNKGNDERLTTPFYPREFSAIAKHIEHEGVGPGMWHVISNKASGVLGLVRQWATGVDWRGHEFRDPNSPWHQQMRDTLGATLQDLEPISVGQLRESKGTTKDVVTSVTGFNKAPKYVTQSTTEAHISTLYRKYYGAKQTPYETALISTDRRKLAKLYDEGKAVEYSDLLDKMMVKYDLTAAEQGRLARNIMKRGTDYNPYLTMFERLTWQQQKRLLDDMSPEERETYLPRANKEHLRFSYEEPTE